MTRVHVLVHWLTRDFWMPLRYAAAAIRARGLDLRFHTRPHRRIADCDVLIVQDIAPVGARHPDRFPKSPDVGGMQRFLSRPDVAGRPVVFVDTHDSTWAYFGLAPLVTRYLKKQLWRDRSRHLAPRGSGREWVDALLPLEQQLDGLPSAGEPPYPPLAADQQHKLGLAWNIGLHTGFWFPHPSLWGYLRLAKVPKYFLNGMFAFHWPQMRQVARELRRGVPRQLPWVDPTTPRRYNAVALFQSHGAPALVQRRLANRLFAERRGDPTLLANAYVPPWKYLAALADAKIVVSTFGWGELCYREFEAFISGAAVIMPDVSHLETWPDFYRPGETYAPLRWDLSDMFATIDALIADDERRIELARRGQAALREWWTPAGMERIATHVAAIVSDTLAAPLR